jgi:hypothetical protein
MNSAKRMSDLFLNVVLMHGFRETDERFFTAFNNGGDFDPFAFDATYDVLIEDVQRYILPQEA